jgi:hypothetical protein
MTLRPLNIFTGRFNERTTEWGDSFVRGGEVDSAMVRMCSACNVQGPYWFDGRQFWDACRSDIKAPRQVTARFSAGCSADGMLLSPTDV